MPTVVQFRRGTTTQNNAFTGAEGELTVDTTLDTLRVHDGSTAGGFELVQKAASQTLTNKTINLTSNNLSATLAQLNSAISDADIVSTSGAETLTNKTIALGNNTVSGTLAQFNTAVTDADLASLAGSETLTNKTLTSPVITTSMTTGSASLSLFDATATTIGLAGVATVFNLQNQIAGGAGSTTKLANSAVGIGNTKLVELGTGGLAGSTTNILIGPTASQAGTVTIGGDVTMGKDVTITGNLTVNGTTTTVNSTTLSVDDKNIELGSVASPTDTTADGGGITLKGATDKTFTYVNATGLWTSNIGIEATSFKGGANFTSGTLAGITSFAFSTGATGVNEFSIDGTLAGNSDTAIPTEKAVKTYVDGQNSVSQTLTNKTISGASNTLTNIGNSSLTNSSISINGTSVSLGGSISGLATTGGDLSQFAATTSAQLLGVISDETGTGSLVFATSPTLSTPTFSGNTNITGHLLPTANITYDLGSATNRFRDLYLSGSSMYLGTTKIMVDGTTGEMMSNANAAGGYPAGSNQKMATTTAVVAIAGGASLPYVIALGGI
jgi:hypothetical protein